MNESLALKSVRAEAKNSIEQNNRTFEYYVLSLQAATCT